MNPEHNESVRELMIKAMVVRVRRLESVIELEEQTLKLLAAGEDTSEQWLAYVELVKKHAVVDSAHIDVCRMFAELSYDFGADKAP